MPKTERLQHHDLCFGCGQANLFGLQLELERSDLAVEGRFFVKQDHQGPPGCAHGGVIATALDEAMALVLHDRGIHAVTRAMEIELTAPAPVGGYVELRAELAERDGSKLVLTASAEASGEPVASARGTFVKLA